MINVDNSSTKFEFLEQILVSLVSSYRYDKEVVDSSIAKTEATKLREAIQAKKFDDDEFLMILSTRNTFQLRKTFQLYKDTYGTTIDKVGCFFSSNMIEVSSFTHGMIDDRKFPTSTGHYELWKEHRGVSHESGDLVLRHP